MKCRENAMLGEGTCENLVGFSMYNGPMETVEHIRVNIWCIPDWTIGFRHKTAEMHFLSIQMIN